jgi:hypothetical protein
LDSELQQEEPVLNISLDNLAELQAMDTECQTIMTNLSDSKHFQLENDTFYQHRGFPRPVVPNISRKEILNDVHDALTISGHLGFSFVSSFLLEVNEKRPFSLVNDVTCGNGILALRKVYYNLLLSQMVHLNSFLQISWAPYQRRAKAINTLLMLYVIFQNGQKYEQFHMRLPNRSRSF